jgi:excinuclease ABC subunit C
VDDLFPRPPFTGFGPDGLAPTLPPPPLHQVRAGRVSRLRQRVREECPRCPGVYGMIDAREELIYVGKAKCLRARLLSYFRPNSRDPKAGRILEQTRRLVWEPRPSEFAALLRELELIRRWQPRCNVQGKPGRRRHAYVCLGRRPAAYSFLAPRPPGTAFACFGPVPAGRRAREAVRRLNDWFRLRDCPQAQEMAFADQGELFPVVRAAGCLRLEIGTCLGPCAAACTRAAYRDQVRAAQAFLAGDDDSPLSRLEGEMMAASAAQLYERAAALRDRLEVLRWLRDRLRHLRTAREGQSFVYPVPGVGGEDLWYLIQHGRVAGVLPAPRDGAGRRRAADAVRAVYAAEGARGRLLAADEVDGVLLVAGWFRRHPEERQRTLAPEDVLSVCRRPASLRRALPITSPAPAFPRQRS